MTTTVDSAFFGIGFLNKGDFFQPQSILHPVAIGSAAIVVLFVYLRASSNRTTAPLTIWDKIVNVALGSTLAGIINGQSFVKGFLALAVLLAWQFLTSSLTCWFPKTVGILFTKPPLIVAFRGRFLEEVMKKNRIAMLDINGALRKAGIFNVCQVECIVVEPTGEFSIHLSDGLPEGYEADVLLAVEGYRKLVEHDEEEKRKQRKTGQEEKEEGAPKSAESSKTKHAKNDIANDAS
ncbi:hypothetical protein P7C73_g5545, partial [Tremellales sp. Uapishka_1]